MRPTKSYLRDLVKTGEISLEQFAKLMLKYYDFEVDIEKLSVLVKNRYFRTKVQSIEFMKIPEGFELIKK